MADPYPTSTEESSPLLQAIVPPFHGGEKPHKGSIFIGESTSVLKGKTFSWDEPVALIPAERRAVLETEVETERAKSTSGCHYEDFRREEREGVTVLVKRKYVMKPQLVEQTVMSNRRTPRERERIATFFLLSVQSLTMVFLGFLIFLTYKGLDFADVFPIFFPHEVALKALGTHCAGIPPIAADEFRARQQALAETLFEHGNASFVAEPGAFAQYFGNISSREWHLSERPLLLVVSPEAAVGNSASFGNSEGVKPRLTVITPTFEADRAHLLSVPSLFEVSYVSWDEDANPYAVASSALVGSDGPVFVDGAMRTFVKDGLAKAAKGRDVITAPKAVTTLREQKSLAELEILKCANEVTLNAIRVARDDLKIGMNESTARQKMTKALEAAHLSDIFVLGLFGENAALPHGSGTDRKLGEEDLILFDVGGSLHGYKSDITRTFALKKSHIPSKHLELWFLVRSAQRVALNAVQNGSLTREPDEAARELIKRMGGYEQHFTHRLGHGLGLETHEAPYLVGGSNDAILPGHVFSDEPGIYITGDFGVRLEDPFYVDEDGKGVYLTEGVGGQARTPWDI